MKQNIQLLRKTMLLMFAAVLLCLSACTEKEEEAKKSAIAGFVLNANTGEPLRAVDITLSPTGLTAVSGSDGRYEFQNIDAGTYRVQASKSGYISNGITVITVAGSTTTSDIMLTPSSAEMSLSVSLVDFGSTSTVQYFNIINNAANGSFQWTITKQSSADWLTVSPTSGSTGAGQSSQITLLVDRSQLTTSATVILNISNNTSGNSITLPVSVSYSSGVLQVTPTSIDFGSTATSRQLTLYNSGSTVATYEVNYNCSWLTVSPTSGNLASGNSATLALTLDRNAFSGDAQTILQVRNTTDGSTTSVIVSATNSGGSSGDDIVVSNGLKAYYTFDDGTAQDQTENQMHAQLMNNATTVNDGAGGYYLNISSIDGSYLVIPNNFFNGYTHWSVSFWVKDLEAGRIFSAERANSTNVVSDVPFLWAGQDGMLAFSCSNSNSLTSMAYNYINASCGWHHYVLIMNGAGNLKFYVDNILTDNITLTYSSSTINSCTKTVFGGDKNGAISIAPSMKLDNIRFYNRSITLSEIAIIYNNEL